MQVNNIQNNNNTSFTSIKLAGGARETLRRVLKPKDWEAFDAIIQEQKSIPINAHLFGNDNKLYAKLIYQNNKSNSYREKVYHQRPFFESAINFLKRIGNKAIAWNEEFKNEPDVDVERILAQLDS